MIREEIKKYIKYCSILREKIKNTKNKEAKELLINELSIAYDKLEFLRGLNKAIDYKTKGRDML